MLPPSFSELKSSMRTAKARKKASVPTRLLYEKGLLYGKVLDYGCGRGRDVEWLLKNGINVVGYDPNFYPYKEILIDSYYDIVLCHYVLNTVLEKTRHKILVDIRRILKRGGKLFLSVRSIKEKINGVPFCDGVITSRGTFQKRFEKSEIVRLLEMYFTTYKVLEIRGGLLVFCKNDILS